MKKLMQVQGLHPYGSPIYPQAQGFHPNPGITYQHTRLGSASAYSAQAITPLSAGAYLPGYPHSAVSGFPPGYPMSAPVKVPFPSPAYPSNHKGLICSPHHPMYSHVVANRAIQSPVLPGAVPPDPSTSCSPFPLHGQSPIISPYHRQPIHHPGYPGGYSHGPMGKGATGIPFSYPPVLPGELGSGMPPNHGMLMVRRDGVPSFEPQLNTWPTSMTPTYPPSFPSQTLGSNSKVHINTTTMPTCQQQPTPSKHGVTVL
uniref:PAM2 domain-containing protein n=1 Tax=Heterorhabditis bacteriophora TaxID=37862 RepID=A0A1I7XBK0_HETBA